MNKTLMIQGTTSDAGKSTFVAALCRIYARQGLNVAPFKPQNMALNSAVTPCGGEIGRAQAVQAQAARVPLSVHFNPVLLKPQSDTSAQVIIQGKALSAMDAQDYHAYKKKVAEAVIDSHQILAEQFERIIVEGAGSPAEINLRQGDIANMGFAEKVDCPVIIIADIDKGGVFAHLVGTLALLSPSEQNRVVGFVINRFRGDIKLLESGLEWLENYTKKPVLGVLPYIHGLHIAAEDAVEQQQVDTTAKLKVIVPVTPRMSNHNDFDALRVNPEIDLQFVYANEFSDTPLPTADLIILAGSKNVQPDLNFIKQQGWDKDIERHLRYGGKVFGICGGYQMLGREILDPEQIESQLKVGKGLGYLPTSTTIFPNKTLTNVTTTMTLGGMSVDVSGYEIHQGQSAIDGSYQALLKNSESTDGLISDDNQIAGCYLHGVFDSAQAQIALANWCGVKVSEQKNLAVIQELAIEKLADVCQEHLDLVNIEKLLTGWKK
ncbi:cobyric acid synthase [Thalassotalea profundi]|uniref:Cobyric acid synthase n=2 Tax=Thalassotalea profundi TaxID=2036687 RepID=A0ABQ3IUN6_9GAMM|nr:cobyric acid synthase [Thalassotalea profundi]